MMRFKVLAVFTCAMLFSLGAAASGLGTNITIWDGSSSGSSSWYTSLGEDQEVEPGNITRQSWDLEGFFIDGDNIHMVGGFDFVNGNNGFDSGDLFIDVNGDAVYGTATPDRSNDGIVQVSNSFYNYDFVLDLDFDAMTFDVVQLGNNSVLTAYYGDNDESDPWRYNTGGTVVGSGAIGYQTGLSNADTGMLGDRNGEARHNLVTLDLFNNVGWDLNAYALTGILFHFTIECGNDNMMGYYQGDEPSPPIPEPASLALLGIGLGGLWMRKRRHPKA